MPITSGSRASIKGVNTKEKSFAATGSVLQSRKLLSGGYLPAKTGIVAGRKYTLLNAEQAATLFGYGSPLHRMAIYHFASSAGAVPTDALPLAAASGGAAATKTITFATNATGAGNYYFRLGSYLADDLITIGVAVGATPTDIAALLATAISNKPNLPFTASPALGVVTLTAKYADQNSQDLRVTNNILAGESDELPAGMTVAIANGTSGSGKSDIALLTAYLAAESSPWYTSVVMPDKDAASLNAVSAVIGNPNDVTGLYDDIDYRPASVYTCDTTAGSAGLTALLSLGNGRKLDCANVMLGAPDYPELGYEIAAYVSGFVDKQGVIASSNEYTRLTMPLLFGPVAVANDWTTVAPAGSKSYDNRNLAVKAGITPIIYKDGVAQPGDMTGFWHPDDNQNAPFKFVVNRIKIWNYRNIANTYINGADLKDRPIVNSAAAVNQSERPIDSDILLAGLAQLAGYAEGKAWIFEAAFTIANTTVTLNEDNPDRFDFVIPIIVSGNNRVNSGEIQVDRNLQAVSVRLVA